MIYVIAFVAVNMSGNTANDPFTANQEVVKAVYAKKGPVSWTFFGDDVVVTRSRRATIVKTELTSSSQGKRAKGGGVTIRSAQQSADIARSAGSLSTTLSNLNSKIFLQVGIVLSAGEPSEIVSVLQG